LVRKERGPAGWGQDRAKEWIMREQTVGESGIGPTVSRTVLPGAGPFN